MKKIFLSLILSCFVALSYAALPSVQLKNIDGKTVDTAQIDSSETPVVISFWATWCKPCIRELNAIHEIYDDIQEETGAKVIAISIDEAQNVQKVKPLINRMNWDYEVLLDENSEFKRAMGVSDPPHAFIIYKGEIVWNHQGYVDGGEEEILEILKNIEK
ncbi:MAG: TlpA family protein disulfide reductase [Erysipelotrichales bacterium]|nr:TlpA family protein disulfide reductase [Erysipelotrichales bacterium]